MNWLESAKQEEEEEEEDRTIVIMDVDQKIATSSLLVSSSSFQAYFLSLAWQQLTIMFRESLETLPCHLLFSLSVCLSLTRSMADLVAQLAYLPGLCVTFGFPSAWESQVLLVQATMSALLLFLLASFGTSLSWATCAHGDWCMTNEHKSPDVYHYL